MTDEVATTGITDNNTSDRNELNQAGDFTLDICNLMIPGIDGADGDNVDIISLVDSVYVYEDLFSYYMSGQVIIKDTYDIPETIGRGGTHLLRLRIISPDIPDEKLNLDGIYYIYKVDERKLIKDRAQTYVLNFISVEGMIDNFVKISKTFKGNPNEIFKLICDNEIETDKAKIENIEECQNQITYTSNFWNPSKNFSYLCKNSISKSGEPTMLIYENRYGLNFKSLETLLNFKSTDPNEPKLFFSKNDYTTKTDTEGRIDKDISRQYSVIQELRSDYQYDFLKDYSSGLLATKMYQFDLEKVKMQIKEHDLLKDKLYDSIKVEQNPNRLYRDDDIKVAKFFPTLSTGFALWDADYKLQRISQLRQMTANRIEIDVFGRTKYTVGMRAWIDVNVTREIVESDDGKDITSNIFTGDYLITAISHRISAVAYYCTLELSKPTTWLEE